MCKFFYISSSVGLLILLLLVPVRSLLAQEPDAIVSGATDDLRFKQGRLAVFMDCEACDDEHIRQEITFVDHVRDRESADVHVLVTDESTGGGGDEFVFHVIGRGLFQGEEYQVAFTAPPTATEDLVRSGIVRTLKVALGPFLMRTPAAKRMSLEMEPEDDSEPGVQADPWHGWTIEIFGMGNGDIEASQYSLHLEYGVLVERVTEDWKIEMEPYFNYTVDHFKQDDEAIRSESREDGFEGHIIRSVSSHWSVGIFADVFSSTFENIGLRLRGFPGVEYSVFPYKEASRRRLTFAYRAGMGHVRYRERTIFNETSELLPQHALEVDYELIQPWGELDFGLETSQFLHDLSKYRTELEGGLGVRLSQGLTLEFGVELNLIHDQLNLPIEDATLEEILLRRRELATNYELAASIGFKYRFGSIYNNVVNTRF